MGTNIEDGGVGAGVGVGTITTSVGDGAGVSGVAEAIAGACNFCHVCAPTLPSTVKPLAR